MGLVDGLHCRALYESAGFCLSVLQWPGIGGLLLRPQVPQLSWLRFLVRIRVAATTTKPKSSPRPNSHVARGNGSTSGRRTHSIASTPTRAAALRRDAHGGRTAPGDCVTGFRLAVLGASWREMRSMTGDPSN